MTHHAQGLSCGEGGVSEKKTVCRKCSSEIGGWSYKEKIESVCAEWE